MHGNDPQLPQPVLMVVKISLMVATSPKQVMKWIFLWRKQKFMYSVFEEMLQTDMGKYFVRLHEADFDAQAVFRKLSAYAKESTQASIDTADLLSYITSVKLHTLNWKGSTTFFHSSLV